jgi:hypothetical protein
MGTPNTPNEPPFDIAAFEGAAKARVIEFASEVARLALIEIDDPTEWLTEVGAQYELSDGVSLAAKHETWDNDPMKVVAKLRVVQPFVESLGADGNLRRAQVARLIVCKTFSDGPNPDQLTSLPDDEPGPPELEELGRAFFARLDQVRLEDRLDPHWRPGELIWARTVTQVECKLPHSPNFRTERQTPNLSADTRMAHMAARRHAGEPAVKMPYDIAEHRATIALLRSIDTRIMEPQPLEHDFDETWLDPEPTIRSWWPKDW